MGTHGHNVLVIVASICNLWSYYMEMYKYGGILDLNFEKGGERDKVTQILSLQPYAFFLSSFVGFAHVYRM